MNCYDIAIFMAALLGSIFYQLGHSQGGARARFGIIHHRPLPSVVHQRAIT